MAAPQRPHIRDEMNFERPDEGKTVELAKNIWRVMPPPPSGNVYLIQDTLKTVLIDSGVYTTFDYLAEELRKLGLRPQDIDLVINTHEHFDHIGGNPYFSKTALIAAHRNAATKIELQDEYVTHMKEYGQVGDDFSVHWWLENRNLIWTGDYKLKILHTPGHTSGSICIYEPFQHFMFTGDTVVRGEILTPMLESGSAGDFVNSIERLLTMKIKVLYPGHGPESTDPDRDLTWAANAARERIREFRESQAVGGKRRIQIRAGSQEA
ncbi:MAG: MBL fold metallo-hydrolase [Anaerolineae bacterium]|nr:MBL fold metallo-hydrolase [Anaerolineae bacterium]